MKQLESQALVPYHFETFSVPITIENTILTAIMNYYGFKLSFSNRNVLDMLQNLIEYVMYIAKQGWVIYVNWWMNDFGRCWDESRREKVKVTSELPKSVETIVAAVDLDGNSAGVGLGYASVALHHDQLGPNLVINLVPFVQYLLNVILDLKKREINIKIRSVTNSSTNWIHFNSSFRYY